MPNRLIEETSPYLLQHAHNPVDWYPWGEEAFIRAMQEDKPIMVSIGYSACHWCHVMEQESFENKEIANILNEHFVSIKVDREERPDLDAIYMEAIQAITGRGGWPLTAFLTPEKKPFFGGTYFPPEDRQGIPGFPRVLQTVLQAYRTRKSEIESAGNKVVAFLNRTLGAQRSVEPLTADILNAAYRQLRSDFDSKSGGLGQAPKFPQPMPFEYFLRYYHRTGDNEALSMVEQTLQRMVRGGIYDQIGGGFHRYSVDADWLVPHFEKMLYDNALLTQLYLHAYQVTGKNLYKRIVEETLDYALREMRDENGGFYSSQDADTEGIEGRYYTWKPDELIDALNSEDMELARAYFGITEHGNFEGYNILSQVMENQALISEFGLSPAEVESRITTFKARLLEMRKTRVAPHKDTKILTDWNGLMLTALAEAASVLDRQDYLEAAISNATFLTTVLYDGDLLKHTYKDGQAKINGYLQDYALLAEGLLSLYEATFQYRWLELASNSLAAIVHQFWDEAQGCFYDAGSRQEALIIRPRNIYDNALPSGSATAAYALIRLARLTGNREYENLAGTAIRSVQQFLSQYPSSFGYWLCALDFYLAKSKEIALVGQLEEPATKSLMDIINQRYLPNRVIAGKVSDLPGQNAELPLLENRGMKDNKPAVYVCEGNVCQSPVTDPEALVALLDQR
jgi:uncharacterized protein YyaL (SSP411 family)